jgi:hypothetical protein
MLRDSCAATQKSIRRIASARFPLTALTIVCGLQTALLPAALGADLTPPTAPSGLTSAASGGQRDPPPQCIPVSKFEPAARNSNTLGPRPGSRSAATDLVVATERPIAACARVGAAISHLDLPVAQEPGPSRHNHHSSSPRCRRRPESPRRS